MATETRFVVAPRYEQGSALTTSMTSAIPATNASVTRLSLLSAPRGTGVGGSDSGPIRTDE